MGLACLCSYIPFSSLCPPENWYCFISLKSHRAFAYVVYFAWNGQPTPNSKPTQYLLIITPVSVLLLPWGSLPWSFRLDQASLKAYFMLYISLSVHLINVFFPHKTEAPRGLRSCFKLNSWNIEGKCVCVCVCVCVSVCVQLCILEIRCKPFEAFVFFGF